MSAGSGVVAFGVPVVEGIVMSGTPIVPNSAMRAAQNTIVGLSRPACYSANFQADQSVFMDGHK